MRGRTEKEKEMPYSLELLVMGQDKPSDIPFKTPLKLGKWKYRKIKTKKNVSDNEQCAGNMVQFIIKK